MIDLDDIVGEVWDADADDFGGDEEAARRVTAADVAFVAHARADVPALVAAVRRLRAYMTEIGAEDVRCTCGSGAHPRHCKRHPWGFAAHVAELNSDNVGDWMNEAMDMERERDESRAESGRLRAEFDRMVAARDNAVDLWNRSLGDAHRIETQRDEARRIAADNEARYVAAERDLDEARRIAGSRYQDIVDLDGRFRQREASIVSEARRWKTKAAEQSAEVERLRAELATARAAAHTADDIRVSQIEELCAVIDGSPDEPTDDELAAHTGAWLARLYNGAFATMTATAVRNARGVLVRGGPYAVRWWALDPSGGFCPRPVVTTVAATLDAGPRDGDGREVTT